MNLVLSSSQKETITLKRGGEKGLGFSIAGGRGSTPYKDGDSVSWFTSLRDKCVIGQAWVQDYWVLARQVFAFLWTESKTKWWFIKGHKSAIKNEFNTQSSSANKFVNNGFSYCQREDFFWRDQRGKFQAGKISLFVPAGVANQSTRFRSSCPRGNSAI